MASHNGEEQTIARLLGLRPASPPGFYVDIGAHHPHGCSNTHGFYQWGWDGLDVEPIPELAAILRAAHPRNTILQCAVGAEAGRSILYQPDNTELATLDPDIYAVHKAAGFSGLRLLDVEVRTMDSILALAGRPIDFLSLDVEGSEAAALAGWNLRLHRPRLLVIEATFPNSRKPTWEAWEPQVLAASYRLAAFDDCNRFYLAD